ncbi:hypothetical protein HP532_28585 [Pseudomonas sp. CrR25]|nr:hypothetical protein [Pseudomonas sp. CrR25]
MPKPHTAVVPFPKRFAPLDCDAAADRFQAAAELRVEMLHKLFTLLACSEVPPAVAKDLGELCQTARGMLTDVVVLYRGALAHGRAGDE